MFTSFIVLAAVAVTGTSGTVPPGSISAQPKQYILDLGGGGGGADNSAMIELCASRAMSGNTCFYQNIHFR